MPAAEYGTFAHGGVTYPVTTSSGQTSLQDADPSLFYCLDYFSSVITTYVGPRLLAENQIVQSSILNPVAKAIPYDPRPFLREATQVFPLLAIYRKQDTYIRKTHAWMDDASMWGIDYVLPALSSDQLEHVGPLLRSIAITIMNRIENMFDPGYQSALQVWAAAQLEEIELVSGQYGRWELQSNLFFPAWSGTLRVKERDMPVASQFQQLGGMDIAIDASSAVAPPILDFVDVRADTYNPATITGLCGWWTPDVGLVLASDQAHVATLADQSGKNNNAAAFGTGPEVLGSAFVVNGLAKPALRFDNLAQLCLQATVSPLAQDSGRTIVCLARLLNTTARGAIIAQTVAGDAGGVHTIAIEANTVSSAGGLLGLFADASSFDTPAITNTNWHVLAVRTTATTNGLAITSNADVHVDKSTALTLTLKSGTGNFQGMGSSNLIAWGGNPAALATTAAAVDMGPVLAFSTRLSDADLLTASRYCLQWAGLPLF